MLTARRDFVHVWFHVLFDLRHFSSTFPPCLSDCCICLCNSLVLQRQIDNSFAIYHLLLLLLLCFLPGHGADGGCGTHGPHTGDVCIRVTGGSVCTVFACMCGGGCGPPKKRIVPVPQGTPPWQPRRSVISVFEMYLMIMSVMCI